MSRVHAKALWLFIGALAVLGADPLTAQAPSPAPPAAGQLSCQELSAALRSIASNDARLRDWADLNRYREANRPVTRVNVVFMGDSITDFWPQPRFGEFFAGRDYLGRGISGQTTSQMLIRMRPDVVALKPRAVVILAGTNDIAGNTGPMTDDEIEGNLASMAEIATANNIKVLLSSILPTSSYHTVGTQMPQTTQRPLDRIRAINTWMKRYAADHRASYVDYYAAMVDPQGMLRAELSNDDLHPNKAGYDVMVSVVEPVLRQMLR